MPKISFKITAELSVRLERVAARQRKSKAAVIREALENALRSGGAQHSVGNVMGWTVGMAESDVRDLGHNPAHLARFGSRLRPSS